ncbi:hydrogenase assembly protein HupF [Kosmotoga arenicorallina S304]|uniref:Hydrogenase assembly protein HupF n=1 Tax=Kosmotoga arenicorallina S304 TaxID=1453497 RepID=A0A176K1A9_9BACT|nr:HypC/HybG/HupF family hydrogenase formation chaperone [Kosmotoga arenicorallina]OAA30668.1 hydrogenase assembly protein HupF [Kosmotoga arenicorallina S304]
MCLAVPLKIIEIKGNKALAEKSGVKLEIDVRLIKDLKRGDYVLVHAGFAIQKVDVDSAMEIEKAAERLGEYLGK